MFHLISFYYHFISPNVVQGGNWYCWKRLRSKGLITIKNIFVFITNLDRVKEDTCGVKDTCGGNSGACFWLKSKWKNQRPYFDQNVRHRRCLWHDLSSSRIIDCVVLLERWRSNNDHENQKLEKVKNKFIWCSWRKIHIKLSSSL